MQKSPTTGRDMSAQDAVAILDRLRTRAPRVHCITNAVAQNFTANALLAIGALPSMTLAAEEIGAFVARAQGLLVNLGTFDGERREATAIAVQSAAAHDVPWVLDPVFVDRSELRAAYARELIGQGPRALRLNRAEFAALSGSEPDSVSIAAYARGHQMVVGLSGETDLVADGERFASIGNGHPLMAKVTAMGCAASAIVAACLGVEDDAFRATTAALTIVGVAGEKASETAQGPGSFAVAILDALYTLDGPTLMAYAKVN